MWRIARKLWERDDGAVAPMVAFSLVGLLAVGGIAFDYAHMAALDTELQQAADQAALAAATQLDGQTGALARATAAAQGLITNRTYLANNGTSSAVTVPIITFCSAFDDSKADTATACATTTSDTAARVVWVKVGGRTANFALTPIVGMLNSGTVGGEAVAGMNSAVCKEPPVMMCNPAGGSTFDATTYIGKGLLLIATGGGGSYAPGDFGFLDVGAGASDLGKLMGYGTPPDKCVDVTNPSTEPGSLMSVIDQFNTRFDMYESGDSIGCFDQAKCPPSVNSRKDLVMNHGAPYSKTNCGFVTGGGGNGWVISATPYRPTDHNSTPYTGAAASPVDAMGYPRDKCHAWSSAGDCVAQGTVNARIGTGNWDIDTYWRVNHPVGSTNGAVALASGGTGYPTTLNSTIRAVFPSPADATRSYPTRYQVYRWELANAVTQLPSRPVAGVGTSYGQPVCLPPGWTPGGATADRRTIPVAVVNCTGINGKSAVNPIDWVDTFLVQPSVNRSTGSGPSKVTYTSKGDIYVEVIGHTANGTGGATTQFIRHDRPYLIR
jgi:Flp pilus assembly protein TadG